MSFVIAGASGSFGRLATKLLLSRIPVSELILVTRPPAKLAALAAPRSPGLTCFRIGR